jgi:hypothetical protein
MPAILDPFELIARHAVQAEGIGSVASDGGWSILLAFLAVDQREKCHDLDDLPYEFGQREAVLTISQQDRSGQKRYLSVRFERILPGRCSRGCKLVCQQRDICRGPVRSAGIRQD